MSKHNAKLNTEKTHKAQKDFLYEIYSACRFCGKSAVYKMPILQNIISIEDIKVELKTKIYKCLQIEIYENDKMPPLICELCVDKINYFYDFLVNCQERHKQLQMRLGLSTQVLKKAVTQKLTGAQRELHNLLSSSVVYKNSRNNLPRSKHKTSPVKVSTPPPTKTITRNDNKSDKKKELVPKVEPARMILKRSNNATQKKVPSKKVRIIEPTQYKRKVSGKGNVTLDDTSDSPMETCDICNMKFPKGTSINNHKRIHSKVKANVKKKKECLSDIKILPKSEKSNTVDKPTIVGKCEKCGKSFVVYRTFRKHTVACRGGRIKFPRSLRKRLKPVQIRLIRCDALLERRNGLYTASNAQNPKSLCSDGMVQIKSPGISETFDDNNDMEKFVHWDSDVDCEVDENLSHSVEKLSTLSLKVIFSNKFLGKVPKRWKEIYSFEDIKLNIGNIINNLHDTSDNKSIFGDVQDNCSDKVSDSILNNEYDSDKTCFHEETNDNINFNDKSHSKVENDGTKINSISHSIINRTGKAEIPTKFSKKPNNKNISEITKDKTELRIDDAAKNAQRECDGINENSPSTSRNSYTNSNNICYVGNKNVEKDNSNDTGHDNLQNKTRKENVICSFVNFNECNSKIDLLNIQLLTDKDEICSHRTPENAENVSEVINSNMSEIENVSYNANKISNFDTKDKYENESFNRSNAVLPELEEIHVRDETSVIENSVCKDTVTIPDNSNTKSIGDTNTAITCSFNVVETSKPNITNDNIHTVENETVDTVTNCKDNVDNYVTNHSNPENIVKVNSHTFDSKLDCSQSRDDDLQTETVNQCIQNIIACNSISHYKDNVDDLIEDNLLSNKNSKSVENLKETNTDQNSENQLDNVEEHSEKMSESDSITGNKVSIYDHLLKSLSTDEKTDCNNAEFLEEVLSDNLSDGKKSAKFTKGDRNINFDDLEDISDDDFDKDQSVNLTHTINNLLSGKSMDLENISDGEFNFDDN